MREKKPKTLDGTNIGVFHDAPLHHFPECFTSLSVSLPNRKLFPEVGGLTSSSLARRLCAAGRCSLGLAGDPGQQSSGEVCALRRQSADPAVMHESSETELDYQRPLCCYR